MLMLALSCLQGRPMQAAAEDLLGLDPDGLQLTPGNVPTPGFERWLAPGNFTADGRQIETLAACRTAG